jgi:carbon monoxide dehydrogenase subunit G
MQFDNSFAVPLPPDQAWPLLMDIEGIAPCMPGAELTEVVDASTYKGRIAVRLGPVALSFAGTVKIENVDDAQHTAKVRATGSDAKGRGGAQATASFRLAPSDEGTTVLVHTDLTLSGAVAQYGRGVGVVQATAAQLMQQFADNLRVRIAEGAGMEPASVAPHIDVQSRALPAHPHPASPSPAAKPISGFSLLWNVLKRMFGKGSS